MQKADFMLAPLDLLSALLMLSWLPQMRWLYHWCIIVFEAIHQIIFQINLKLLCEYAPWVSHFFFILLESHLVTTAPQKLLLWLLTALFCSQSHGVCLCSSQATSHQCVKHCMCSLIRVFVTFYYIISLSPFPQSRVTAASFNLLSKMSRKVPGTDQNSKTFNNGEV